MSIQEIKRELAALPPAELRKLLRFIDAQLQAEGSTPGDGTDEAPVPFMSAYDRAKHLIGPGSEPESDPAPAYGYLPPFPVEKRVAGLGKGRVKLAPDFDAPLPDTFWLGEE